MTKYIKPSEIAEEEDRKAKAVWNERKELKKKSNEQRRQFLFGAIFLIIGFIAKALLWSGKMIIYFIGCIIFALIVGALSYLFVSWLL